MPCGSGWYSPVITLLPLRMPCYRAYIELLALVTAASFCYFSVTVYLMGKQWCQFLAPIVLLLLGILGILLLVIPMENMKEPPDYMVKSF